VVAVTLAVALLTTVFFALVPAMSATRVDLARSLKDGTAQAGGDRRSVRARNVLVVTQVAAAVVLLVGTGLMVRSVAAMQGQDLGFRPEGVLTMGLHLPTADYADPAAIASTQARLLERVQSAGGIEQAALVTPLPLNFASFGVSFEIEGRPAVSESERLQSPAHWITPAYFAAMAMPVLQGRAFSPEDRRGAPPVLVVNRRFAETWWPDSEPLGRRLRLGGADGEWATVVGVVADSKTFFVSEESPALVYLPLAQEPRRSTFLVTRVTGSPHASFPAVRDAVDSIDRNLPLSEVRSMSEVTQGSMLPWEGTTRGLLLSAGFALLLAVIGIYGVVSHAVASRTGEIGLRRALGASPRDVLAMVLREGLTLVALGLAAGLLVGIALSRLLASLLFGIGSFDPWTWLAVATVLTAAAAIAATGPALRALRVDPMRALRYE
jgi:predicted permease